MKPYRLQVNHMANPVGIEAGEIHLSWIPSGSSRQTAYWIVCQKESGEVVFDSGLTQSEHPCCVIPAGVIETGTRYRWCVYYWDEQNCESEKECGSFETGIGRNEWKAFWIDPEPENTDRSKRQRASYLRKRFLLNQPVRHARLYLTAHGIVTVRINGKEVTDHLLMPGETQVQKRLRVETLDVTDVLHEGWNEIHLCLGDGWYRGCMGNDMTERNFGDDIAVLCQLESQDPATGKREVILVSDDSWEATQEGPLGLNDLMMGEEYDARRECLLKEDGGAWHKVQLADYGAGNLIGIDTVPVKEHESFHAKLICTPDGSKVLDFGQNMAGRVHFHIDNAKAGQKIILTHGETLDENGNFTIANFQNEKIPKCYQRITYTCKEGRNDFVAEHCIFGFRYVKTETDLPVDGSEFTVYAVYSDISQTAWFSCGNQKVNRLFQNALWSMKSNIVSVPTDCPTRERSGFSGDAEIFIHTAAYLMDCWPVYASWLREQAAGQFEDGCVPQVAPFNGKLRMMMGMFPLEGMSGWGDSIEIIPAELSSRYDDDTILEEQYETIRKWLHFLEERAHKPLRDCNKGIVPEALEDYLIDQGFQWGEWLEPGVDFVAVMKKIVMEGEPEVATAFYAYGNGLAAGIAERLAERMDAKKDYTETVQSGTAIPIGDLKKYREMAAKYRLDAERYRDIADKAAQAYRCAFLKDGRIKEKKRQCCYVRPVGFNLLLPEEVQTAVDTLAEMVHDNGDRLNTGFLSTHMLCRVLSDHGHADTAYDLLLQEKCPGWLYAVDKGATTIWENWDGIDENGKPHSSLNHYSYGAIAGWLMDSVCGIRLEHGHLQIRPVPDRRLGSADGVYESPAGRIEVCWQYAGNGDFCHENAGKGEDRKEKDVFVHYQLTIPGCGAEVHLPGMDEMHLPGGVYDFRTEG